jgi:hypothetical protein
MIGVRNSCLVPFADGWTRPTEIRAVLKFGNLSGSHAAAIVGVTNGRTVRRWTAGTTPISYAHWAVLCEYVGLGRIWVKDA